MMAPGGAGRKPFLPVSRPVLLTAASFVLPVLLPALFGWLTGLLAVPVAYLLVTDEDGRGMVTLRNSLLIAGGISLPAGQIELFLFTLTMLPLGYTLYTSGRTGRNEAQSGAYGAMVLGVSWLGFWMLYGMLSGINPYQQLLTMLDQGFAATLQLYMTSGDIPVEMQAEVATVIGSIRRLVPMVLPGILCCGILLTTWMNMVILNGLLLRHRPDRLCWQPYSRWRLPEQLIWIPIAAGVAFLVGSGGLRLIALNLLLVSSVVYFFQGLAVMVHLLARWKVPGYLRALLYVILVIQSYGLLLVALLGVSDTWLNFRAPRKEA